MANVGIDGGRERSQQIHPARSRSRFERAGPPAEMLH